MRCQPEQPYPPYRFRFPFADIYIRCRFRLSICCFSSGNLLCGVRQKQLRSVIVSTGISLSPFIRSNHHQRSFEWFGRAFFPILEPHSFFSHHYCLCMVRHSYLGIKCLLYRMVLQPFSSHHSFFAETEKAHRCITIPL